MIHIRIRGHGGARTAHYCRKCIESVVGLNEYLLANRIRVPEVYVRERLAGAAQEDQGQQLQIAVVPLAATLAESLRSDPSLIHRISPGQFEEFVCDRLSAMGLEPHRVGHIHQKDGGVDVLFWPKDRGVFPFLGAVQVKHQSNPRKSVAATVVRDFAGVVAGHHFNAGLIVTNTRFSPDAEWFAERHARLVRLRGFRDLTRWLSRDFSDDAEWREIPTEIELCPGVRIAIPRPAAAFNGV